MAALEKEQFQKALGLTAAGLQFTEQYAIDARPSTSASGDLNLAWDSTLLERPLLRPKAALSKGQAKGRAARDAYATLTERSAVTAASAAEKDWITLTRLRQGLAPDA